MNRPMLLLLSFCLSASLAGSGCSVMHTWRQKSEETDVGRLREQRREQVVSDFERRRMQAQLRAAQEHAEHDPAAAEEILLGLVERDARNIAPRLQLAELYWAHDQLTEAEEQLREALAHAPQRADLHHLLGLVLDAQGREAEGCQLLARAVELDPANELYRASAASAGLPLQAARVAQQ